MTSLVATPTKVSYYDLFPSIAEMHTAIEQQKKQIANINRNADRVADNYYNCLDDYSFGGLTTQAHNWGRDQARDLIARMEAQIEANDSHIFEHNEYALCDMQGNVLSHRIVKGAYGPCWVLDNTYNDKKFFSPVKKQATYNKKGLQLMQRTHTFELYYTTRTYSSQRDSRSYWVYQLQHISETTWTPCTMSGRLEDENTWQTKYVGDWFPMYEGTYDAHPRFI
jgi:hypothetical protein